MSDYDDEPWPLCPNCNTPMPPYFYETGGVAGHRCFRCQTCHEVP